MNLAEAFSVLAQAGCRLKAETGGGIILDVPPGGPPVPSSVLQALATHRESLVAVLSPAETRAGIEVPQRLAQQKTITGRPCPYARDLGVVLAQKPSPVRSPFDASSILARARAAKAAARDRQAAAGQLEQPPSPQTDLGMATHPQNFSAYSDDSVPF